MGLRIRFVDGHLGFLLMLVSGRFCNYNGRGRMNCWSGRLSRTIYHGVRLSVGGLQCFWCVLSQVLPVPVRQASRAKYFHSILVEAFTANHHSSLVPFEGLVTVLVLYGNMIADVQWR